MEELTLVTWNCNGAFRKKFHAIQTVDADIYVIQECEDPLRAKDISYLGFSSNHLWAGPTKNKGLGVFAKTGVKFEAVAMELEPLELFLPVRVNDDWPLLAAWTRQANSPNFRYIGQLWKLLQGDKSFLAHTGAAVIGDLNSNKRWDEWDRWWNHSDVVRELGELGLQSAYHQYFQEPQGEETRPTLFLQRNREKAYHIDYGFFGPGWSVQEVQVGQPENWLEISDHMPVIFKLKKSP